MSMCIGRLFGFFKNMMGANKSISMLYELIAAHLYNNNEYKYQNLLNRVNVYIKCSQAY